MGVHGLGVSGSRNYAHTLNVEKCTSLEIIYKIIGRRRCVESNDINDDNRERELTNLVRRALAI